MKCEKKFQIEESFYFLFFWLQSLSLVMLNKSYYLKIKNGILFQLNKVGDWTSQLNMANDVANNDRLDLRLC